MLLAINDIILLIIVMVVMVLLFGGIVIAFVLNQKRQLQYQNQMQQLRAEQQNQLIEAAIRSEEIERHRIAEALHDEIGALLSSSKLHFQAVKNNHLDQADRKLLEKGAELLNEGIHKVRSISHNLHSNILKEFGLNEAIRHFTQSISSNDVVTIEATLENQYRTIKAETDIIIYRIIQELMNNMLRHARPRRITIESAITDNVLHFTLSHNGNGITQKQFEEYRYQKKGLGFKNILNRMISLKGDIQFSQSNDLYFILIKVPINSDNYDSNKGCDSR